MYPHVDDEVLQVDGLEAKDGMTALSRWTDGDDPDACVVRMRNLTGTSYPPHEAQALWRNIVEHKRMLDGRLDRNVGVTVAALDYLTNVAGALEQPVLIEQRRLDLLVHRATRDALTGLYDRSSLHVLLKREIARAQRADELLSALMIDVDHFKHYNDVHGHLAGDILLRRIALLVLDNVREMDIAARYGGEELCVILPRAGRDAALEVAERIRAAVARSSGITVSIGVATLSDEPRTPEALIGRADEALYRAKRNGRNCLDS